MAQLFADEGVTADRISVDPAEWSDVEVGDSAKTGVATVAIDGEPVLHFEMLLVLVGRGDDTALAEVDQVFETAPAVDVVEVGRAIAERIRSGPPSPERIIAEAGLVTIADLPSGWAETGRASSGGSATDDAGTSYGEDKVLAMAKRIPACKAFVTLLDTSRVKGGGRTTASRLSEPGTLSLDGARFRLGAATVTSQVSVYPTSGVAKHSFDLMRTPSTKSCVSKLYRRVANDALESIAAALPAEQRELLKQATVEVATPESSEVGDDHVLFTVTVDLRPLRDARFVIEQEFVQVGRVVGLYTFSAVEGDSIREGVVRLAGDRLGVAPTVR